MSDVSRLEAFLLKVGELLAKLGCYYFKAQWDPARYRVNIDPLAIPFYDMMRRFDQDWESRKNAGLVKSALDA